MVADAYLKVTLIKLDSKTHDVVVISGLRAVILNGTWSPPEAQPRRSTGLIHHSIHPEHREAASPNSGNGPPDSSW
jgi:hypothetical protein